jgi:hypothetical protein
MNSRSTNRGRTFVLCLALAISIIGAHPVPAVAASGNQGYAVYRNGVIAGDIEWHAALLDDPHWNTTTKPIIHIGGFGKTVRLDSWASFLEAKRIKEPIVPSAHRPRRIGPTSNICRASWQARTFPILW